MYLRAEHTEASIPKLQQFIRDNPLGIITTAVPSKTYPLIQSSHVPWLIDVDDETQPGTLRGHMARMNPQSKAMIESLQSLQESNNSIPTTDAATAITTITTKTTTTSRPDTCPDVLEQEVLVLFNSPAQSYVTPKFYTATKPTTGKVVPTWNYAAVQAYGRARIYYDAKDPTTDAFLRKQIAELSFMSESHVMGYTGEKGARQAWSVEEAPERYIELLKQAIIGVEIVIDRLQGKFKMSQEMGLEDRQGVAAGFASLGTAVGDAVSEIVRERSERIEAQKQQKVAAAA